MKKLIRQAIYDPDTIEDEKDKLVGEVAGIRAAQALQKAPRYTHKGTQKQAGDNASRLAKPGQLQRNVYIHPDKLDEFLKPYEEAARSGATYAELNQLSWLQLQMTKGDSQGRMVDQYKDYRMQHESEVLFHPFSEFKIKKVERNGKEITIWIVE